MNLIKGEEKAFFAERIRREGCILRFEPNGKGEQMAKNVATGDYLGLPGLEYRFWKRPTELRMNREMAWFHSVELGKKYFGFVITG
jgi:hypothetical protein